MVGTGVSTFYLHDANLFGGLLGSEGNRGAVQSLNDAVVIGHLHRVAGLVLHHIAVFIGLVHAGEEGFLDGHVFTGADVLDHLGVDDVAVLVHILHGTGNGVGFNLLVGNFQVGLALLVGRLGHNRFARLAHALIGNGIALGEILVVGGAGTNGAGVRVGTALGANAQQLPVGGAVGILQLCVHRIDGAFIQRLAPALGGIHLHGVAGEIVLVTVHLLHRLRCSRLAGRGRRRGGNFQRDNMCDAIGIGIAFGRICPIDGIGETRRDDLAILLQLDVDGLADAVIYPEQVPTAFGIHGHEVDTVNVVSLHGFGSARFGGSLDPLFRSRIVGKGLTHQRTPGHRGHQSR